MGKAGSTYGRDMKCLQSFSRKYASRRPLKKPGYILENDFQEMECINVDWMHLGQNRAHWWALVNTAMNFCVRIKGGEFLD
jgi:hypothetical protein